MAEENKIESIDIQKAKINSFIVEKFVGNMNFTAMDYLLIRNYQSGKLLRFIFSILIGGAIAFWIGSMFHFSSIFLYSFIVFGAASLFFLSAFIYKALMMNIYMKIRKEIKNIEEYSTFIRILLKNSYQIHSEADIKYLIDKIDSENMRVSNGEKFGIANIFKSSGDDLVLIAINNFSKKYKSGIELVK